MSRLISSLALVLTACAFATPSAAQLVEGRDYSVIDPPHPTGDPNRIVVTEFFSYQCPHCYHFDPALKEWVSHLPDDVTFERFAISLGYDAWAPIARAFYTLQTMDALKPVDSAIFQAIHEEHVRLYDEKSIVDWVAAHGVDATQFVKLYHSFAVDMLFDRAEQLSRIDRVPAIPTLVIAGKYMVQIEDNGKFDEQLARVDQVIAKVRAERAR